MSYKSVGKTRLLGLLIESPEIEGCAIVIDDSDCELILFDRATNSYYKLLQVSAKVSDSGHTEVMFDLEVNLDDANQVEYKGQ
jgi:hypothetical protein